MLKNNPIYTIIAAATAMGLSVSLSIPLVSLALERRDVGADIIGWMGALPALAFLMVSPLVPALARMFGSGPLLWASIGICSGSILGLAFSENLVLWFLLRLFIGVGMSILFLISETWINQVAKEEKRGQTIGIYVSVLTGGFALGPILINFLGSEGSFPFIVSALIVASSALIFLISSHDYPKFTEKSSFSVLSFIRIAPVICSAALLLSFFDGAVMTLLPVYGVRHAMTEGTAVLMTSTLLAGNILLQYPIGWIADRVGENLVILVCGIVGLGGSLALPYLIGTTYLLWPALLVWGGAVVGTYTLALVIMGRLFTGAELITANATAGVLWGVGSLIGPAIGGYAMKFSSSFGMPLVFAALCAFFVSLNLWQITKKQVT
ncbi:MFS transporter [Sneathiella limimaris]|uniref:MFS transporter n=1 Tax=Sneathiella limimaris TaxID=1964213 RepID=UPI00146C1126|nr:MFS transporter [Sneathiella limimaris]